MRILGIDHGLSKIGLSIGDTQTKVASPLEVFRADGSEMDTLKDLVVEENIDMIVLGIPYGGGQQVLAQKFLIELNDAFDIPVIEYDESFTTAEATKLMKEGGLKGDDDSIAAMVMLQSYLDTLED